MIYPLLYKMTGNQSHYYTETLQTTLYSTRWQLIRARYYNETLQTSLCSTRWQVMPSRYYTETLQTTLYSTRWHVIRARYYTETLQTTLYSTRRQIMMNNRTMTLRLYRLPSALHDDRLSDPLLHWDSMDYPLLYTMTGNQSPYLYWNSTTTFYYTRWQIMPSPLDYDTDILQTTIYSHDDRKSERVITLRLCRLSSTLHDDR